MSRLNPWWTSDTENAKVINEIDEELSAERRARSDLADRMVTGQAELRDDLTRIGSRLDSATDLIGTVLEWTELRFRLLEYDEYRVRGEIRKTFRALAQGLSAPPPEVADIPGYWMPPAALDTLALLRGGHRPAVDPFGDPGSGLRTAHERDGLRTELFALAVGLCFDLPAFTEAAVPRLLFRPVDLGHAGTGRVAAGWRTLWVHTARGAFGDAAATELADRLAAQFDPAGLDDSELAAWDRAIETFGAASTRAEAFTALHAHLTAGPDTAELFTARDSPYWRGLLQELIEEPGPAERPLVHAMEDLHLPPDRARRSAPGWAADTGTVAALIRRDLFDPAAPAPLRHLAHRLATPLLHARLTVALTEPGPVVTTLERRSVTVEVTSAGYDTRHLAIVDRRIVAQYLADAPSVRTGALGTAGLAALTVVLAVSGQWLPAVLCALGTTIPLWKYLRDRTAARAAAARRDEQLAEIRAALDRARVSAAAADRRRAEQYAADRAALDRLLAALATAPA